jgi:hypothetical protein
MAPFSVPLRQADARIMTRAAPTARSFQCCRMSGGHAMVGAYRNSVGERKCPAGIYWCWAAGLAEGGEIGLSEKVGVHAERGRAAADGGRRHDS